MDKYYIFINEDSNYFVIKGYLYNEIFKISKSCNLLKNIINSFKDTKLIIKD